MKPRDLLLCAECDEVWPVTERLDCPSCGSSSALPLSRLTGNEKGEDLLQVRKPSRLRRVS